MSGASETGPSATSAAIPVPSSQKGGETKHRKRGKKSSLTEKSSKGGDKDARGREQQQASGSGSIPEATTSMAPKPAGRTRTASFRLTPKGFIRFSLSLSLCLS